jgi:hypothetical protein
MRGLRTSLVLVLVVVCMLATARLTLRAQVREGNDQGPREGRRNLLRQAREESKAEIRPAPLSVQDALQHPFAFTFAEPTSLEDVCQVLRRSLMAPVVLDLAALDRLELTPEDTVQLQLEGVRLKTGLKLLLDQVDMTFQVVPEDNLLILTDTKGSEDPIDHILSELKALHRDVHSLQDTVEDIQWLLGGQEGEGGAMMRKPTIIEEVPGDQKPGETPQKPPAGAGPGAGGGERPRSRRGI